MPRHGSNCTAGSVYTYYERQKDSKASGYGSKKARLGKDSIKEFDCCCLTLQPCKNPVVTRDGYLYEKEAILEYILHQKRDAARKLKEYEKQKSKQEKEEAEVARAEYDSKVQKFVEKEKNIVTKPVDPFKKPDKKSEEPKTISNMTEGKDKALPSFWIPSLTPHSKPTLVKKPDEKVRCPMSGKPIKLKDLIPVNFTHIKDGDPRALITKIDRYVCAVTNDILGNTVPVAVLRTSGSVVTMECVDKLLRKDMLDPINSKQMTDKDIIQLHRGSSGFVAGADEDLYAKKHGSAMMA